MKLSEQLKRFRADRPDEWRMDEFIHCAKNLEDRLQFLMGNQPERYSYRITESIINQID